jgi:hypothetical protein
MAVPKVARPFPIETRDVFIPMNFKNLFRSLFKSFGYPLKPSHALPASVIAKAEKRLEIKVPFALRDYYLVAGRERRFNQCHNRLLPPSEWRLDKRELIFMEENQWVVFWGVSIANPKSKDRPVYTAVNDDPLTWHREHTRTSGLLAHVLHYHAVSGGMPFVAYGDAPKRCRLEDHGYTCYGKVNSQHAYSREGRVVFVEPPGDLPFMRKWRVLAGAKTKEGLENIEADLCVTLNRL